MKMLHYNREFNRPIAKCVNALIMNDPRCTPIYEQNYCSQEAALITPNEFLVFVRHLQCLKLSIIYRMIKFRTFEHFQNSSRTQNLTLNTGHVRNFPDGMATLLYIYIEIFFLTSFEEC